MDLTLLADAFNNSKFIWGISMAVVNMGSRFVLTDLGKNHEKIFNSPLFKPLIFFSIFFMATRDLRISLILTVIFWILFMGLLHEDSMFCFIPSTGSKESEAKNTNTLPSREEYLRALEIVDRYHQKKETFVGCPHVMT